MQVIGQSGGGGGSRRAGDGVHGGRGWRGGVHVERGGESALPQCH